MRTTNLRKTLATATAAALLPLAAAAQQPPADAMAPFKWFRELAGACWKGDHPDGKTSDTQCFSTQYNRFVRGTIRISAGANTYEGDSLFWWDAKNNKLAYTQWASNGFVHASEAAFEGDRLVFLDRPKAGTTEVNGRAVWSRVDANTYQVTREARDGAGWKPQFSVVYKRTK